MFSNYLIKLIVNGKTFDPAVMKPDLLKASIEILKTSPGLNRIKYRIILNNYIRTINSIYSDAEIMNKNKALQKLQNDPKLTIEQLKQ